MLRSRSFALVPTLAMLLVAPAQAQTPAQNDSSAKAAATAKSLPLIPGRTLKFTATEGTWISLDLSPDGGTILFELLGDLYTLPVAGGTARRITSGAGYDMQPSYSPDGRQIVFVNDRDGSENISVADSNGANPRALTTGERESYVSPVWSPDGKFVVATKGTQLWLYHKDGGSGVQMSGIRRAGAPAGPVPPAHLGAAFGNDPRHLWVNLRGSLGGGFGTRLLPEGGETEFGPDHAPRSSARVVGAYQIGQLDRGTGRVLVRTHELEGAFRPVPSPDDRWLVYATRYDAREALKLQTCPAEKSAGW